MTLFKIAEFCNVDFDFTRLEGHYVKNCVLTNIDSFVILQHELNIPYQERRREQAR